MILFQTSHRSRWVPASVALVGASAVLACALLTSHELATATRREVAQLRVVQLALESAGKFVIPDCGPELDYAQSLPPSMPLDKLVQSLQDNAKALGANVVTVSGENHAASPRSLATMNVTIVLHGPYPAIKAVLAESLSRFESGVLVGWRIKRAGSTPPIVEDANVDIVFPLRSESSAPAGCRTRQLGLWRDGPQVASWRGPSGFAAVPS